MNSPRTVSAVTWVVTSQQHLIRYSITIYNIYFQILKKPVLPDIKQQRLSTLYLLVVTMCSQKTVRASLTLYLKMPDKLTSMSLTPDLIVGKQWILNIGAETPDFTTFHPVLKKAKDNYFQVNRDHPKCIGFLLMQSIAPLL